jgi:hypothetical protein
MLLQSLAQFFVIKPAIPVATEYIVARQYLQDDVLPFEKNVTLIDRLRHDLAFVKQNLNF